MVLHLLLYESPCKSSNVQYRSDNFPKLFARNHPSQRNKVHINEKVLSKQRRKTKRVGKRVTLTNTVTFTQ
jgi:hypothetical protein